MHTCCVVITPIHIAIVDECQVAQYNRNEWHKRLWLLEFAVVLVVITGAKDALEAFQSRNAIAFKNLHACNK
jgi:hypothetical protein